MTTNLSTRKGYNSTTQQDFVAVENEKGHGCDVYADGEVQDWQDGNGILAHDEATKAEVREAAAIA